MINIYNQLLSEKNIGFALYDNKLNLVEKSENLTSILKTPEIKFEHSIFDTFPEFFGSEKEIYEVQSKKKFKFSIEKVNKLGKYDEIKYLDFTVIPSSENQNYILVIVSDSTSESSLHQKIKQQQNEIKILRESLTQIKNDSINNILGKSELINSVKKFITKVSNVKDTSILITGESGTGKTLIARAIHNLSNRNDSQFVEINCATIPATLLESEIFGHVKGAFTNAVENKKGLLEEANGGTLFLDEIGELPISLQPKLLTFLETKKYRSVGSTKENQVNTRIITATNRDLKKAVEQKEFREDLFYRINVVSLEVPALRERNEDIMVLANHFIKHFSNEFCKTNIQITGDAEKKLINHSWPGNIRELKNVIERAMIFCEKNIIDAEDIFISESGKKSEIKLNSKIPDEGISFLDIEKKYIKNALDKANGNQSKAAKLLNLSLDTFRYRLKKFKIS